MRFFFFKTVTGAISRTGISHKERKFIVDSGPHYEQERLYSSEWNNPYDRRSCCLLQYFGHVDDISIIRRFTSCTRASNFFCEEHECTYEWKDKQLPTSTNDGKLFTASRKFEYRLSYLELLSTPVPGTMPMQHRETNRRQLRETQSKKFQTGFIHSRKD